MNSTGIALFVYNRPNHTREVLEGLKANNISNLYIFSDGSKNEKDVDNVKEVRNLIKEIKWCDTEIHVSFHNKGLSNSIVDGVNYILSKHEQAIILEDDCVPSYDFVSFMQTCFDKYSDKDRIMSISGYSPPIKIPADYKYDVYFSYRPSSWGWGTWRKAWNFFEKNEFLLQEIEKSPDFCKRVIRAGDVLIPLLKKQIKGEVDSWAVFWSLNVIKRDGVCVYPVNSKINNIGFDGSGVHCKPKTKYDVKLLQNYTTNLNFPNEFDLDGKIIREFRRFYSLPYGRKIRAKIKNVLKFLHLYVFLKQLKLKILGLNKKNNTF